MFIKLSKYDADFVLKEVELTDHLRIKIVNLEPLSEEEADDLRELCASELGPKGFNSDYSVNWKGKRLEDLIDKLYTG